MQFCIHKEDASRRSGLHHIGKIKHFFSNKMKKIRKFFYADKNSEKSKGRYRELWIFHRRGMPCGNELK